MSNLVNVILCGGSGSRLWPLSRPKYPKQFVKVFGGKSLLQLTAERNSNIADSFLIVVAEDMYHHAVNQLEELSIYKEKEFQFLCEPVGKNTLPAILLASFHASDDDQLFITPSDQVIENLESYEECVRKGRELASTGKINTFGIKPRSAHTGFGYIEANGNEIKSFKEKPNKEVAEQYLQSGNYLWNAGLFLASKKTFLEQAKELSPKIYEQVNNVYQSIKTEKSVSKFSKELMDKVTAESIDYGLMENTKVGSVVECDVPWNDLGNFESLANYLKGSEKNILHNESKNSFFFTDKKVVSFGLENIIAVEDSDTLFIGNINESEKVKEVYSAIKSKQESDLHTQSMEHRPWGSFYNLADFDEYKVKRIEVLPGKSLSLQKHLHRSEHWIVVKGQPTVTVGNEIKDYKVGEHIYIGKEEVHRLENKTETKVTIVEVQLGSYLGEDDIIRLEDVYGRA